MLIIRTRRRARGKKARKKNTGAKQKKKKRKPKENYRQRRRGAEKHIKRIMTNYSLARRRILYIIRYFLSTTNRS